MPLFNVATPISAPKRRSMHLRLITYQFCTLASHHRHSTNPQRQYLFRLWDAATLCKALKVIGIKEMTTETAPFTVR